MIEDTGALVHFLLYILQICILLISKRKYFLRANDTYLQVCENSEM